MLSACKPADDGDGIILRLSNPTAAAVTARVTIGLPVQTMQPVRLDESPLGEAHAVAHRAFDLVLGAHRLESVRLR